MTIQSLLYEIAQPAIRSRKQTMRIKRSTWAVPVAAIILFGIGLVVMVQSNMGAIKADTGYPLLTRISAVVRDVDELGAGFEDAGGKGRSVAALAMQAQQVRTQLQALEALPGEAALAERLSQEFEAWYRPAMEERLGQVLETGHSAAPSEAVEQHYGTLQADLQAVRLFALRRFAESALERNSRAQHVLAMTVVAVLLVLFALGLLAWWSARTGKQRPHADGGLAPDDGGQLEDQRRALALLKFMHEHLDKVMGEVRALAPAIRHAGRPGPDAARNARRDCCGSSGPASGTSMELASRRKSK